MLLASPRPVLPPAVGQLVKAVVSDDFDERLGRRVVTFGHHIDALAIDVREAARLRASLEHRRRPSIPRILVR